MADDLHGMVDSLDMSDGRAVREVLRAIVDRFNEGDDKKK